MRDYYYNNYLTNAKKVNCSDIDIVSKNIVQLKGLYFEKTGLNGYKYKSNGILIDFWNIYETYAYKKFNKHIDEYSLPYTTVFNINSIAMDIKSGKIYEAGFFRAFESKTIEFNNISYLYDFPELQAVRAFSYAKKLNFKLSEDVKNFIYEVLINNSIHSIINKLVYSKRLNIPLIIKMYEYFFTNTGSGRRGNYGNGLFQI